jgi:soluble lytic murein transglycosylase-like protein
MADLKELAGSIADKFGIPRNIFGALVQKESSWNVGAVGAAGEIGLTQIKPGTAAEVGYNPFTPEGNLTAGAAYLAKQYKKFGNWNDALAAYNGGPGNIQAGQGYASTVLGMAGVTGSNVPGTQPAGATSSVPGSGGNATASSGGGNIIVYIVAIGLIALLVLLGSWSMLKGT